MNLLRDITSLAAPAPEQLEIGQIAFNARTGVLYGKKTDGSIVKWVGMPLCDTVTDIATSLPIISFLNTDTLCCGGSAITVVVNNLLVDARYRLSITDLKTNSGVTFSEQNIELLPLSSSSRNIILNLTVPTSSPTAILKFSVSQISTVNNVDTYSIKSERILTTTCKQC